MNTLQIILICICSVLAILFTVVRAKWGGHYALILKILASFGFVASAFIGIATIDAQYNTKLALAFIGIGLLLGMIGDIVLDLKVIYDNDKVYLNTGMLSFGLGHIAYFSAFSMLAINLKVDLWTPILVACGIAIVLTIGITLSSKKMGLNFGDFLWQTILYTFILSFMTVYSLVLFIMGGASIIVFIGMLLFFLSDIVLSFQYFGGKISSKPLIVINHLLYYGAQIILLTSLFQA